MARHLFRFRCPCCDKRVELDTRSGKARAVKVDESKAARDIDKLVSEQKHEGKRLTSIFDQAAGDQIEQKKQMDQMFNEALEETKEDQDEKPPNPFDRE